MDDGFVRQLAQPNEVPPAQNNMEPKEVELKNTVAYLCHFYAVNHSTTFLDCMKEYGTKLTKDNLNTAFTDWKKLLDDNGAATDAANTCNMGMTKDTMFKALQTFDYYGDQ